MTDHRLCGVILLMLLYFVENSIVSDKKNTVCEPICEHGSCNNSTCICDSGWTGNTCSSCFSRIRLTSPSGFISDGRGNYSENMRCAWLLDASHIPGAKVSMKLDEFVTECGWDHVFLYDGDGVFSKQLAALSGVLTPSPLSKSEFVANSGQGFVYFYSDLAYNMSGFNISYKVSQCPFDCNANGICNSTTGKCLCNDKWKGEACNEKSCRKYCVNGKCEGEMCQCFQGFTGPDCNTTKDEGVWTQVLASEAMKIGGRASHATIVYSDSLWIHGGLGFTSNHIVQFARFDFGAKKWTILDFDGLNSDSEMSKRYDHTIVSYKDAFYVFGGVINDQTEITNELWKYDTVAETWQRINRHDKSMDAQPYAICGHTAHVIDNVMIVIFGLSPYGGYLNVVQEFHFLNSSWRVAVTTGVRVYGTYGHSSVFDPQSSSIFVYGGYYATSTTLGSVSDRLYKYIPKSKKWEILRSSGHQTFLHAAALSHGIMIVTGGNAHNESLPFRFTECYSPVVMAYSIECDEWYSMNSAEYLPVSTNRYGHSLIKHKSNLYLFGGFNGRMLENMLKFTPGDCSHYTNENDCVRSRQGIKCRWYKKSCSANHETTSIINSDYKADNERAQVVCALSSQGQSSSCNELLDCESCTRSNRQCFWCLDICQDSMHNPPDRCSTKAIIDVGLCAIDQVLCRLQQTCTWCNKLSGCIWEPNTNAIAKCTYKQVINEANGIEIDLNGNLDVNYEENEESLNENEDKEIEDENSTTNSQPICTAPCSFYKNCTSCGNEGCMWCNTLNRCIDINSYLPSFPYGQCTQWKSPQSLCYYADTCEAQLTCKDCQDFSPRCGWCDDGSATGLGKCLTGGFSGAVVKKDGNYVKDNNLCPNDRWYFFICPPCQCNGHGYCSNTTVINASPDLSPVPHINGQSGDILTNPLAKYMQMPLNKQQLKCEKCDDFTHGKHCHNCIHGYYGNALNGGNCTKCICNGQASGCDSETGNCFCRTKGVSGKHCDKCDQKYVGDNSNKTCFYELSVDFIFTFSLKSDNTEPKDKYVTQINFLTKPPKEDTDVTFKLTCSGSPTAKVNLSVESAAFENADGRRKFLQNTPCSEIERTFTATDFKFGPSANTSFYVYLYDFKVPVIIQISFAQTPPIDWLRFFVTFACCFIFLLFIAAVAWKIKLRVDLYRRRQRMFVEMAQMASRPFGCAQLELPEYHALISQPSPICIEPLKDCKACVLTLAVKLPTGGKSYAPIGQNGLAVASALCWLTPNQVNLLQTASNNDEEEQANKSTNNNRIGARIWNLIMPFR